VATEQDKRKKFVRKNLLVLVLKTEACCHYLEKFCINICDKYPKLFSGGVLIVMLCCYSVHEACSYTLLVEQSCGQY
jgi:hypothetical protein